MSEEALYRLEGIRASRPGMFAAAIKAVAEGRVDPKRFGLTRQQVEDAAEARPRGLEAAGIGLGDQPAGLEAIVRLTGRPPLLIRNDAVELETLDDFPAGTDQKIKAVEPFIPSVGRVEFINHSMTWGGTGWVVDRKPDGHLVLTNRHVAKLVAKRGADGGPVFMRSPVTGVRYGVQIDFNEEVGATVQSARVARAGEVIYLADDLAADMALLKVRQVEGAAWAMPDPIPLADHEAEHDELVALVGYPAYDPRRGRCPEPRLHILGRELRVETNQPRAEEGGWSSLRWDLRRCQQRGRRHHDQGPLERITHYGRADSRRDRSSCRWDARS
jgi:endonuclease G, mitochondrial